MAVDGAYVARKRLFEGILATLSACLMAIMPLVSY